MKEYTSTEPVFSDSIQVVETTDPAHADNINAATKQLLQNTLANRQAVSDLFGFSYAGDGLLYNVLGCSYGDGVLIIPPGRGTVEDGTIILN